MIPAEMQERFYQIHRAIPCAHGNEEMEFICERILKTPRKIPGAIIECGTFAGGSTAKLSVVAKHLGRQLIACDSFKGLPKPEEHDVKHIWYNCDSIQEFDYTEGLYATSAEVVRNNIDKWGEGSVVRIIEGYYDKTLPTINEPLACIVLDVDLIESIKTCVKYLWPLLQPGCQLWTHEAVHNLTAEFFTNEDIWREWFGHPPLPFYANHPLAIPLLPTGLLGFGYIKKPLNGVASGI